MSNKYKSIKILKCWILERLIGHEDLILCFISIGENMFDTTLKSV